MTEQTPQATRILVAHPDAETRDATVRAVEAVGVSLTVFEATSLTDAAEKGRRLDPQVILLGLDESPALAQDVARQLRQPGRTLVGLYSPHIAAGRVGDLLRAAARAGVSDFIPLPVSESELAQVLAVAAAALTQGRSPEGHTTAFFSQKGGVGVTTLAVNTALALAADEANSSVVLCEANPPFGTAAGLLGIKPELDLAALVADLDQPGPLEAYLTGIDNSSLKLVPAAQRLQDALSVTPETISRVLIGLRQRFDRVVVDVPASFDLLTLGVLDLAETICVVTEPVTPTVLGTRRLLRALEEQGVGKDRIRVVLNRAGYPHGTLSQRAVADAIGRPVDVAVPHDARVIAAADAGEPLALTRTKCDFMKGLLPLAKLVAAQAVAS